VGVEEATVTGWQGSREAHTGAQSGTARVTPEKGAPASERRSGARRTTGAAGRAEDSNLNRKSLSRKHLSGKHLSRKNLALLPLATARIW
jgi:hypothetical protein